jgi:spermidine synthase
MAVPKLVYYKDGIATTVSVDQWGKVFSLKNNGKVDASNDADMPTQISVGLLPLLLYHNDHAPKVALVGFGSGVTAGAVTQYPIASLEVVELEPAIYEASHFFDSVNQRPLENPKVRALVGDGRNFLSQRSDQFDVIISQPSNPWITGVSNLFTREYFQDIKARLRDDGIFCQWAQLYEMAPWNIKAIYRTLAEEFPYVMVFAAEDLSSDTILIASRHPINLDVRQIARAFQDPIVAAEAKRAGFASPHDVPAFLLLGPEELRSFTAGARINTDDNALIEFAAPRDLLGLCQVRSLPGQDLRPHVALRPPERAGGGLRRTLTAPWPWRGWRAACWLTARRARPTCGSAGPRLRAAPPRWRTRACCWIW